MENPIPRPLLAKARATEPLWTTAPTFPFFRVGDTKIELLESTDPQGPIGKFIENKGPGVHHLAFAVDQVEEALKQAADHGVRLIDEVPRKGAEGLQIGFLHPKSTQGVLTEFCGKE